MPETLNLDRKAKIIATIGPASDKEEVLRSLIQAGMNVARLNFSHGSHATHLANIQLIRRLSGEMDIPVMILQDLQGPKLRVGKLPPEGIRLVPGELITFSQTVASDMQPFERQHTIPFDTPQFYAETQIGKRLLLDDGKLSAEVIAQTAQSVTARVLRGGILTSHKGVNLPGTTLAIDALTSKDITDLKFGLAHRVDAIAVSFIRRADDISAVRELIASIPLKATRYQPLIIAKIEKPEAVENIDAIIEQVDGVMVARGDLAVETSIAKVPIYQKQIIRKANRLNKIVITATQMLESMVNSPTPTRAEAADIANAVLDGSDALMLSGESAAGRYPVESVQTMATIIVETEQHGASFSNYEEEETLELFDDAQSVALATAQLARDKNVRAIYVFTESGKTARLISKTRTPVKIIAFTPNRFAYHQLSILWGVEPHYERFSASLEGMIKVVEAYAGSQQRKAEQSSQIIIVSGHPFGTRKPPNFLLLHTLK